MANEQVPEWVEYKGPAKGIKVLRVWQLEQFAKSQIALAIVSDADFQQFVQDPRKLKEFLIANKVFPETEESKRLSEITHWASLMSATYQEADPDPWLLTIVHGNPCRGAVASQPFEQ
jgi:hypothetical protein